MQIIKRFLVIGVLCVAVSCSSTKEAVTPADYTSAYRSVSEYIEYMPVDQVAEQAWLNEQLLGTGREGLVVLTGMLTGPDTGDDRRARYALSSLATWVTQPGLDADRKLFEETLLEQFSQVHAADAKIFLIRQLEVAGSDRSVPLMSQLLDHEELYPYALRMLTTLNSNASVAAVREALQGSEGERRVAIVYALGDLKDEASVRDVLPLAASESWPLRRSALYMLSETANGDAAVSRQFTSSLELAGSDNEVTESTGLFTAYAANLAAAGLTAEAGNVSRDILDQFEDAQIRSSALVTLAEVTDRQGLLEDFTGYYLGDEPGGHFGGTALRLLSETDGEQATAALVSALEGAPVSHQAALLYALADREDPNLVATVGEWIDASDPAVSGAAAEALFRLGGDRQLRTVMNSLIQSGDEERVAALESVLLQFPTRELTSLAAGSLSEATPQSRPALIRILSARQAGSYIDSIASLAGSDNRALRMEVWEALQILGSEEQLGLLISSIPNEPDRDEQATIRSAATTIINRTDNPDAAAAHLMKPVSDGEHLWLIAALPAVEGAGIHHLEGVLNSPDEKVRVAALHTLGQWRSVEALPVMLTQYPDIPEQVKPAVAEGYIRLVAQTGDSASEKAALLRDLAESADSSEERAGIIGYFASAEALPGLQAAAGYFSSSDVLVSEQAFEVATGRLASLMESSGASLGEREQIELYNTALAMVDSSARDRLVHYLRGGAEGTGSGVITVSSETGSEATGPLYGALFNGESLEGWEPVGANPDSWGAEDGILFTTGVGSGWLSTEEEYDNFVLELEYKVPEGGNSGVFLRSTREGNPAYQGLEIQILDDYAERYAELQPYQYTGSIYNIKAPSSRVSRPAGEWQHMKIIADGPQIQVEVNGEMIVNTSLVHHMEHADGHPGLTRRSGYIGLQNHSSRVDFRNIIIREIDRNDE